ncbi:phospholipase A1-II 7-like [Mangifera indica]|uniref:phospholipase A1-II 7-like n=1 Tax=Mangifera indica TaxID=29780 RepID=UPI001CF93C0A|nr:phospholipase A1-II 7-like [Mangifera indica]
MARREKVTNNNLEAEFEVPDNLDVILSNADSTDILDRLHAGVFLNEKTEKFWFDEIINANVFELYARGLSIAWKDDQRHWNWTSMEDTEHTDTEHMKKGLVINKILIQPVTKDCCSLMMKIHWGVNFPCMKKKSFFSKVGPDKGKAMKYQIYQVKRYIYALVNVSFSIELLVPDRSAWIGYVAVATDEGAKSLGRRDILVCWRGTYNNAEWERNANFFQTHAQAIFPTVPKTEVHYGFYSIYTHPNKEHDNKSAGDQVIEEVKKLINLCQDEEISVTITGYSLGATLATLNASDIVCNGYNKPN